MIMYVPLSSAPSHLVHQMCLPLLNKYFTRSVIHCLEVGVGAFYYNNLHLFTQNMMSFAKCTFSTSGACYFHSQKPKEIQTAVGLVELGGVAVMKI